MKRRKKTEKDKLKIEADKLWHLAGIKKWGEICFFNNSEKRAENHTKIIKFGHHIKPKGLYPHLRYDLDNFLNVCWACHYKLEKCDRSMILDVREQRGKTWYNRLEKKAKQKPDSSFLTINWYSDKIKVLSKFLSS